jgi:ribonuclease P protein component
MLPKEKRISRKEFPNILKNGKRYHSPHLSLSVVNSNTNSNSKFSFSVSKKICKNATDRNRLRRQGYYIISENLNNIKARYTCFFSFKKGKYPMLFTELKTETLSLLKEAHVLI